MRIVGYKVKCDRIIMFSKDYSGDCIMKDKILSNDKEIKCSIDESCKMLERFREFISRYTSL